MAKQTHLSNVKLAKGLEYNPDKPHFPKGAKFIYGEVKKDGLRGFALKGKLYTASGVRVVNAPAVEKALKLIGSIPQRFVIDGEMFYKNCDVTKGIVKTQTKGHELGNKLVFYIFDIISNKEWEAHKGTVPLKRRKVNLEIVMAKIRKHLKPYPLAVQKAIQLFEYQTLDPTDEAVQKFHKKACKDGHEGTMIKDPMSVYSFRKNKDWQKLKPYRESDLKVVGAELGTGRNKKRLGKLHLKGIIDGKKVKTKCGGGFKDVQRDAIWRLHQKGKLVGKIVELEHEGLTKNLAVRFPVFRRFHPSKNK